MKRTVLNHLHNDYTEPIRDPVWKNIYLSRELVEIIKAKKFQKLNRIKQLGPAYLVYPGATHTRLNHSLGVFAIAHRLIKHLAAFEEVKELSIDGVKSFLCAALLHDLGHFPFAHSLKDIAVKSHEELTAKIILNDEITDIIKKSLNLDPVPVAAIIDENMEYNGSIKVGFYRRLLSGVLDPDKLDYLNRDAYFCGVPYGVQDVDFILGEVRPVKHKEIAVTEKGLSAVESLLFAKYLMYRSVYWHKTVRIATAMIKKAIVMGLRNGIINRDQLYGLDDNEFFLLLSSYNYPPFKLVDMVLERKLYKLVYRTPFDENNMLHKELTNVSKRTDYEKNLSSKLSKVSGSEVNESDIIIDIPEPISFETKLSVYPERKSGSIPFVESASVFQGSTIKGFTGSLRYVSVLVKREEQLLNAVGKVDMDRWFGNKR